MLINQNVTIADVARLAGVSTFTASNALNNRGQVAAKTRERVLKAAAELGYVANFAARSLRGRRSNVVGMLVGNVVSPYFSPIVAGAAEAASELGRELLIHTAFAPSDQRKPLAFVGSGLADAVVVLLPNNSREYLGLLERIGLPVVLVNHHGVDTELNCINGNNTAGARAATEHLIGLGHRRIAFLKGTDYTAQSAQRFEGYRQALLAAGLPLDEALVGNGQYEFEPGRQAADALLSLRQPPTAIFAANDLSALGVLRAAEERGLQVPHDLSVVGFDDIPMAELSRPALTTVRHPLHQMGQEAIRRAVALIEGRAGGERRLELPSELIVRGSTARNPR